MNKQGIQLKRRQPPDLELESLIKRHFTKVQFFQGSSMDCIDLARVKVCAVCMHTNMCVCR